MDKLLDALGGCISQRYLLLTQQPQALFLALPRIFLLMLLRFIDDAAQNSGQRLDNVNRTQLVVASGKLIHKKPICCTL